jgi:hypothetical protein
MKEFKKKSSEPELATTEEMLIEALRYVGASE